jgi:hypothetical protein
VAQDLVDTGEGPDTGPVRSEKPKRVPSSGP